MSFLAELWRQPFEQGVLETARLTLEPICLSHAEELQVFFSDPDLHEFVPFEPPTLEQQREKCLRWEKRWSPDRNELWLNWAGRDKQTGTLIAHIQAGVKQDGVASIGYVVSKRFQNQGFATEALERVFDYLRITLSVREVKAWTDTRNAASHCLAKKLGMVQIEVLKNADFFKGAASDEFVFSKKFDEGFNLQPVLRGKYLWLRPLAAADFEGLFKVSSDPLIWELHPEKTRYQRDVFERFFQAALDSKGALVALDAKTNEIIGSSRFSSLDLGSRRVEVGYTFLARKFWGKGYNTEMKRLMLSHAFQYVNNVYFYIGENNLRSRRAVEKIGAKLLEKIERQPKEGATYFATVYGIERSDFLQSPLRCIRARSE